MVDTGAPTTTIDAEWATRHGLRSQPYQEIGSMGGKPVQTYIAPINRLQIAGFQQVGGAVQVANLKPLSSTAGIPIDAVIGVDFLLVPCPKPRKQEPNDSTTWSMSRHSVDRHGWLL
ncbi:retropepsin-like aspartic protease [Sphingomonas parapaucimobilis]|uniref:retropepsin-like aspartic protease n=1 Tax=Sphingomonas parapaucimobilis TaxID=28213 RepID=UPI003D299E14